jgi:hypothetical protein
MPLSPKEVVAAKKMYRFVRGQQRLLEYPRWMMWSGGAHIMCFNGLITIFLAHDTFIGYLLLALVSWAFLSTWNETAAIGKLLSSSTYSNASIPTSRRDQERTD